MAGNLKMWFLAIRPRTLVLSLAGTLVGGFVALSEGSANIGAWSLCAVTAMLLQALSNLANDYGDFEKGVDNAERVGPKRPLMKGQLSAAQMKKAIVVTTVLALLSGAVLVFWVSRLNIYELTFFALLGLAAVAAAMLYTLGKRPYGYRGLGDVYCFIFFGIAAVFGTYYLTAHQANWAVLLPAAAMGFMSNAVLNINNMRDAENDRLNGKKSLVVKIGQKNAYIYHVALIVSAFVCLVVFAVMSGKPLWSYAFLLLFPFFVKDLVGIKKTPPEQLDPYLGKQAVKTFVLALAFGLLMLL